MALFALFAACGVSPPGRLPVAAPQLGEPIDAVFARLGPPTAGGGDEQTQHWSWTDAAGKRLRVAAHANVVFRVAPEDGFDARQLQRVPLPAIGPYPGQPLAELVRQLGNPGYASADPYRLRSNGGRAPGPLPTTGVLLVYGKHYVHVAAGRVLSFFVPEEPTGPR